MDEFKQKKKDYQMKLSKNSAFNIPEKRGNKKPSEYTIYNDQHEIMYNFIANAKDTLKVLGLPINTFIYSARNGTKIKRKGYKGWYMIKH